VSFRLAWKLTIAGPAAYAEGMTTEQTGTTAQAPADGEAEGKGRGGLALDIAGGIAALVLIVIIFDIWSDGRLSRRLGRREQEAGGDPPPAGS
jgi:hypothetical protein